MVGIGSLVTARTGTRTNEGQEICVSDMVVAVYRDQRGGEYIEKRGREVEIEGRADGTEQG